MVQTATQAKPSARERLLELAEAAVLQKGFSATSIDELIAGAGISKSGFFYHFRDKGDLAKALLNRYLERDETILNDIFDRARELHDDPLHSFLIGLKMFAEMMAALPEVHPGCLVASFCYQDQLCNREIRELNAQSLHAWRRRFRDHLDRIARVYPANFEVDLDALADMIATLVEGGIILSKVLNDREILARQVLLYRAFIQAAFART